MSANPSEELPAALVRQLQLPPRLPPIVRSHDIFNLLALAALNVLNIGYLVGKVPGPALLVCSLLYFVADLLYVGIFPACVKSPQVILGHHLVSVGLILIPWQYPRYTWCLAYCMLVEVNTWLLIARRTITVAQRTLQAAFYVTWVALRNIWYPYLIYVFWREWQLESAALGTPWNPILVTPIFQTALTGLNVHWSIALFGRRGSRGGVRSKQL